MTNESFFGLGFVGTVGVNFETAIVAFFYSFASVFLTFSFRGLIVELLIFLSHVLIVESYWDCIAFGQLVKFWL